MDDVIFIGNRLEVEACRSAGIPSYAPALGQLCERVMAERGRCRVLAMTEDTFNALPADLARELREGIWPQLAIVPAMHNSTDRARFNALINRNLSRSVAAVA